MPETQTRTPFPPPPQAAMKLSEALERLLISRQGQELTAEFLKKTLLQLASFCDRLFSQLHQLERDSLRRLECLGRRVEAAALVARARAARAQMRKRDAAAADGGRMKELNKELDQLTRENAYLRREAEGMGEQIARLRRRGRGKGGGGGDDFVSFGPTILVEEAEENGGGAKKEKNGREKSPERSSSLGRSSSKSDGGGREDDLASRLTSLRQRSLVRDLRRELLEAKRRHRRMAEELVRKDCASVDAHCQISRLHSELDGQRRECYGHLKVMQQLRANTSSPPPVPAPIPDSKKNKNKEKEEDVRGLQLELSRTRRELAGARRELEAANASKKEKGGTKVKTSQK